MPLHKTRAAGAPLALTLCLFAFSTLSCGGPVDDKTAGFDALQRQDYDSAVEHFDKALATLVKAEQANDYKQLTLAACKAEAHTNAEGAKERFIRFAADGEFEPRDVVGVVRSFLRAKCPKEGLQVLHVGIEKHGQEGILAEYLANFDKLSKSNPGVRGLMDGLGYGEK